MANVVINSEDFLGKSMAGPAIRCWEFARELSKGHAVTLIAPNPTALVHDQFKVCHKNSPAALDAIKNAHVLITQQITPKLSYAAKKNGCRLILDAYCPVTLEILEQLHHLPPDKKELYVLRSIHSQCFSFKMADSVICASDKQKDFWLGLLATLPELSKHHKKNSSLAHFLDVVPYGLSSKPLPSKNGAGPREIFSLSPDDKILLWGGSISDWFDPCTLVRAMKILSEKRSDVKLVFMGVKHPNDKVPEMSVVGKAIALAKELNVYNRFVFFNTQWIPYEQRHNFLKEASIGVSIHSKHLETRFSFRTRILDYLWAGLPIVATEGDSFADLIEKHHLGIVVPYHDSKALADAVAAILDDSALSARLKSNVLALSHQFQWEKVTQPIRGMINQFMEERKPPSSPSFNEMLDFGKALWTYYRYTFKILGAKETIVKTAQKLRSKF